METPPDEGRRGRDGREILECVKCGKMWLGLRDHNRPMTICAACFEGLLTIAKLKRLVAGE